MLRCAMGGLFLSGCSRVVHMCMHVCMHACHFVFSVVEAGKLCFHASANCLLEDTKWRTQHTPLEMIESVCVPCLVHAVVSCHTRVWAV